MKVQHKTRVHGASNEGSYIIGTYRFHWVAWLRGWAHIIHNPHRSIYLDRIQIVTVEQP